MERKDMPRSVISYIEDTGGWLSLGTQWKGGLLWEVICSRKGVMVSGYSMPGPYCKVREVFPRCGIYHGENEGSHAMVNKYITAVRQRAAASGKGACELDPCISQGRPAVTAFLTETDGGEGKVRERSVLMLAADEGGLRVGLKASEFNGWVWRTAATLQEGLDALEKALTDPEAAFRPSNGQRAKKRRRRG